MNIDNIQTLTISTLLHDIGKVLERASPDDTPPDWSNYRYEHSYWTSKFFEKYGNLFPFSVSNSLTNDPLDNLKGIASYHHNPSTFYQKIVAFADQLAAGADRDYTDEEYVEGERKRKILLEQIFSRIKLSSSDYDEKYYYDLKTFEPFTKNLFPIKSDLESEQTKNYSVLFQEFINGLGKIKEYQDYNQYLLSLISLMEKTMWAIPSTTRKGDIPDVSLFDHSKTSAAIANCILQYCEYNNIQLHTLPENDKLFLLISGDLSGIQNYIFSLNNTNVSGTAKILRARSFYLQNFSFQVVRYILHKINLPIINQIMDAGGRFVLIAPNIKPVKENLAQIKKELDEFCRIRFGGVLNLNLTWDIELSKNDLKRSNFYKVILKIGESLENAKKQKLNFALVNENNWLNDNFILGNEDDPFNIVKYREHGACNVCGKLPATILKDDDWICQYCSNEIEFGRKLVRAIALGYPLIGKKKLPDIVDDFKIYCEDDYHELINDINHNWLVEALNSFEIDGKIFPLKILTTKVPVWENSDEELFNLVREDENEVFIPHIPKTFYHLAMQGLIKENNPNGKPMLGILKADVDRLGFIFSEGIRESVSISKYAFLSRMLNAFFSGYVSGLLNEKFSEIYTVYSGGDDLFLIGEWKEIFQFAKQINSKFNEFSGFNPSITLSAGIALIDPKFPINKGALKAEEYLEDAKDNGRNRLHIFETTIEWNKLPRLMEFADYLDRALNNEKSKINNSFLYRLLDYHHLALLHFEENSTKGLKYLSHLNYDIRRNIIDVDKAGKIISGKDDYEKLILLTYPNEQSFFLIQNLKIPLFYTIYKNRGKKIKKQNKEQ